MNPSTRVALGPILVLAVLLAIGGAHLLQNEDYFCSPRTARRNWMTSRISSWEQVQVEWQNSICVYRFAIAPTDAEINNGVRAEFEGRKRWHNGDSFEYEFATKFSSSVLQMPSVIVTQWHESLPPQMPARRPPLAHRVQEGALVVTLWNDEILSQQGLQGTGRELARLTDVKTNVWYEFQYRIRWRPDGQGAIEARRRECPDQPGCAAEWREWIQYSGAIGYSDATDYYLKFGIYTTRPFANKSSVEHFFRADRQRFFSD